ncbi:hypothetical protein MLD38_020011 [Melastoma candidum]|uniref:Uncharacterized protein n=1 Tax=Melastoma candidum TaxID=119954 RepID=A0ACB9QFC8_9MYRT|nr:hypothetical protein MLD38_020011 [Melastoma candidum]
MPAQKRPFTDANADGGSGGAEEDTTRAAKQPRIQEVVKEHHEEQVEEPMDGDGEEEGGGEREEDEEDEDAGEDEDDGEGGVDDEEEEEGEEEEEEEEEEDNGAAGRSAAGGGAEDSQGSQSSEAPDDIPDFVYVRLADIRKDVQCPICLGIIRKTRTVMECLHRFCRECIDKSMRLGNNECPACRTHCASRRSLRDDTNYDALISALYPDIDKYEEEELAFHEEERNRNKQIQASIAQILQRQSEALAKRRSGGKDAGSGFATRSQRNLRSAYTRRRRNRRGAEHVGSEDYEDENDSNGGKDSSSADERITEVRPRRRRRRTAARSTVPSTSADCDGPEQEAEASRDTRGISPGLVWNPEMLAWGRASTRSHTRHGGSNGSNKNSKNSRISKLVEYLKNLEENDELDVYFMLVPLEKESTPSLKQPYLSCRASLSMKTLCDYIANQTTLQSEEVEILLVNGNRNINIELQRLRATSQGEHSNLSPAADPCKDELRLLDKEETLAGIAADSKLTRNHMILGYRRKKPPSSS